MAVRLEFSLPRKLHSTVKKLDDTTKTTLDHVRRIHSDHDYLKHSSPIETNNQESAIVEPGAHACERKVNSDIQGSLVTCGSRDVKDRRMGDFPNEGIQASDLCSLLDKFEEAFGNSPSVLTPATSPGHSENCKEPLSLKINSHVNATALTPPTTPPVQEHTDQKLFPSDCKPSAKPQRKTAKLLAKNVIVIKDKILNNKVKKVQQKPAGIGSLKVPTLTGEKAGEINGGKRKSDVTTPGSKDMVSTAKKVKVPTDNESQLQFSKVCRESKIELAEAKDAGNVNSAMRVENSFEKANNETLRKVTCPNAVNLIEEKSPALSKNEKDVEHSNDVQEMLDDKKCSNIDDADGKSPNNIDNSDDKLQNNNGINLKIDIHRTMNDNNDEITGEKILNDVRKDQKDSNDREDEHRRNSRDTEDTRRKSEDCYEKFRDNERKMKKRSRSISSDDDDSSADERSNPRKSERNQTSVRHSERGRKREKYRRYHSRNDEKYSDDERVRHRSSDDNRHRNHDGRRYDEYHHDDRRHDDRHHSNYERKDRKCFRDIEEERKIDFRLGRSNIRDNAKGERRVIYVGGLPYGTTRDELWNRFRKFGPIEKVTVHLRVGDRDNYGFVTFFEPEDALECVERGNSDPSKPHFDLCFGGRRQFCGGSYVDFDSTMSTIEEMTETRGKVDDDASEDDDFDSLLRMCQEGLGR